MRIRWRMLICLLLCGVLIWFLVDAADIKASVLDALLLCTHSAIPAIFPFFVVSSLLLSLGFGELLAPWLSGFMEPLFRVPGSASAALVLGLIGGYPIGASTSADLYRRGLVTQEEAERLLGFCNNSNPVFLISVLGVGVFGSFRIGVWLWLIHVFSALLTGICFRGKLDKSKQHRDYQDISRAAEKLKNTRQSTISFAAAFVTAVRSALTGILSVCAFIVFFYVLARPLKTLGSSAGVIFTGALELFSLTPLLTPDAFGFITAAGLSGWGGISVLFQTIAILDGSGLHVKNCFWGKLLQGIFSTFLAMVFAGYLF